MNDKYRFLEFNIGIVFISTSAILGRYILSSSWLTTFLRSAIACICLYFIAKALKQSLSFNWKEHGKIMVVSSIMMAAHWTSYFYSLDYSNVSVGLMTLYTFPAMTAVLEPIWYRQKIERKDIILAVIALIGVGIIAPPFTSSPNIQLAIALGLFSAFIYSIRNIWITSVSHFYPGTTFMMYQLSIMSLVLIPGLFFTPLDMPNIQWGAMIFLGVVTTAFGHTIFLRGLNYYKATTASLLTCVIPVYGLTLGYLILGEELSMRAIIGSAVIIGVVVWKSLEGARQSG